MKMFITCCAFSAAVACTAAYGFPYGSDCSHGANNATCSDHGDTRTCGFSKE